MTSRPTDVIVIGIHIVDILGRPVEAVPAGQGIAFLDEIRMTVAGTGAGTAVDMARLGLGVASFGVVGDDELGRWLRHKMHAEGIDVEGIATDARAPTSATMLPIRPNGERPALHVIGANALLGPEHLDWSIIERARFLHIGGTSLMVRLDGEPTAEILRRAQELGVTTSLDLIGVPASDHEAVFGPCYPHLDHFLPNEEDALMLAGASHREDAVRFFHDRGVKHTVLTLGGEGASYAPAGEPETVVPAYQVPVVDTTGCGDAFSAGYIAGLAEGLTPLEAVEIGVAAGSCVATGLGSDAGLSTRSALDAFMATTPRVVDAS
jgi:sugar/nucleoside kinase (ribokinase family)